MFNSRSRSFGNITQRAVYEFCMTLLDFESVLPGGSAGGADVRASQQSLWHFFQDLYDRIFNDPESFKLPVTEDMGYNDGEAKESRPEITKAWYKPKTEIRNGLDFLYRIGRVGAPDGETLRLTKEEYEGVVKSSKVKRQFIKGMQSVGLGVSEEDGRVTITNPGHPGMMAAWAQLALGCSQHGDMGFSYFHQCNFRALDPEYRIDGPTRIRMIAGDQCDAALELHDFLEGQGYKAEFEYPNVSYQGNRRIKSTPLVEMAFDPRSLEPFTVILKFVSVNRLMPFLQVQPRELKEDFLKRSNACSGCGWCTTRKGMEPSTLEVNGQKKTVCCWAGITTHRLEDGIVGVIGQYVQLHGELA